MIVWALVRYEFPFKRLFDAIIDIPFALPTAVAGIALTTLFAENGWLGGLLLPLGIKVSFTPLGILVALIFIGIAVRGADRAAGPARSRSRAGRGRGDARREPLADRSGK